MHVLIHVLRAYLQSITNDYACFASGGFDLVSYQLQLLFAPGYQNDLGPECSCTPLVLLCC